jgi:hypothetical protein
MWNPSCCTQFEEVRGQADVKPKPRASSEAVEEGERPSWDEGFRSTRQGNRCGKKPNPGIARFYMKTNFKKPVGKEGPSETFST